MLHNDHNKDICLFHNYLHSYSWLLPQQSPVLFPRISILGTPLTFFPIPQHVAITSLPLLPRRTCFLPYPLQCLYEHSVFYPNSVHSQLIFTNHSWPLNISESNYILVDSGTDIYFRFKCMDHFLYIPKILFLTSKSKILKK